MTIETDIHIPRGEAWSVDGVYYCNPRDLQRVQMYLLGCTCKRAYARDPHKPGCPLAAKGTDAPLTGVRIGEPKCSCGADAASKPYPAPGHSDYCGKYKKP